MTDPRSAKAAFTLESKSSVVTGGGSGIGRAIALRFASAGSSVFLLDLNFPEAGQTAQEIREAGGDFNLTELLRELEQERIFAREGDSFPVREPEPGGPAVRAR